MRHLEAAAIGLVFAIAAVQMSVLTAKQSASVHYVGAQRALAWALLRAQGESNVVNLLRVALNGTRAEIFIVNEGDAVRPTLSTCYGAALVNATTGDVKVLIVCTGP